MGASGWSYRAPYQDDIDAALQQLRWDVYRSGNYYKEDNPNRELSEAE
jgi:hypothetical protein